MKLNLKNLAKVCLSFSTLAIITACSLFGPDVTGTWSVSSGGDSKMQLQQKGGQITGYAYYNGQNEGQVVGQIDGVNITLQIRKSPVVSFTGIVSQDGVSMQLSSSSGQVITLFKTK